MHKDVPFWLSLILALSLGVVGQISLKWGLRQEGKLEGFNLHFVRAFFNPWVLGGLFSYAVSSLFWLIALSQAQLSFVYPFISLNFAFIALLSWLIFQDTMNIYRILGILLICLGVFFVSRS
ncbi:EamA family transporter [bacterium]|nr:EamA family transporter [bacterium]